MSDHSLYILTHSSVFSHLRIIDFRGNWVKSLETLKVNYHLVILPSLKEFYVNWNVDSPEQSYNISFFFNGLIDRFTKLDVLWVEAKNNSLFVKKDKDDCIQPLLYSKLFLTNIVFEDEFGQEILDNLKCWENLELRKWVFKKLAESDVYNGLCNLKHFALSDNLELFDDIFSDKQLFSTLKYLKVSNIKSKNVFKLISKLRVVGHLVLSNLNLSDQDYKPDVLFPVSLYKLEVVRWKVEWMYLFDQLQPRKINIVDLTLFDNEYDLLTAYTKMIKSFSQTPNPKITRLVMDDLIFTMHSRATGK